MAERAVTLPPKANVALTRSEEVYSGRFRRRSPPASGGDLSAPHPMSLSSADGAPRACPSRSCLDLAATLACGKGRITSGFLLSFCMDEFPRRFMQGGQRSPRVEALTKRRKYEDSFDLKVSLRVARANGVGDFSRLMLGITWARFEGAHLLSL